MQGNRGLIYSGTLHGIILLVLIVGLPDFFHRETDMEPEAVSIEVLPIAPISNVKPQDDAPKENKPPQEEMAPKPRPETHAEEKPEEEQVPLPPKQKQIVKPPPKPKPPKPKPKKNEDPLRNIFKSVEQDAAHEGPQTTHKSVAETSQHPAQSTHYDPGAPLSMSEKDAIRQQIESNWNAPVGAKDAANLKVSLHIELTQDGTVTKVEFSGSQSRYASDSFFRAAVDSAIRAVERASPLKNLPPEKYNVRDGWSEMYLDFDPRNAQ